MGSRPLMFFTSVSEIGEKGKENYPPGKSFCTGEEKWLILLKNVLC